MTSTQRISIGCRARRTAEVAALALSLVVAGGCSQPDALPLDALVRDGDAYLDPVTRKPYSGPVYALFADAPLHVERRARLVDGRYDGPVELYSADDRLSVRETYREGVRDGPYEWYVETGELYEKGTYRNGRREGPYEAYFAGGELYERGSYRHGDFDGPREWYLGGRLVERVTYVRGRIEGPYERFSPDGTLEMRGTLHHGLPCGSWIEGSEHVVYPTCAHLTD